MTTISIATNSFTRPADTTAYAVGDLVANSTTAASVVPIELDLGSYVNYNAFIRAARLTNSSKSVTNASFRIHLFSTAPTVATSGDNGAAFSTVTPLVSNGANYLGAIDLTIDTNFTDVGFGRNVPKEGSEISTFVTGDKLYALIEARAAYTPTSAEVFTLTIEAHRY